MSKITLNFFGETIMVNKPNTLSSLRNEISQLFCLSAQDAAEIILTYKKHGEKQTITNDEDLKTFLNSKTSMIDLEISQTSKLFQDNLNKLQEENLNDKKTLDELLKKRKDLNNLKESQFVSERKELKEIETKIFELFHKKNAIRKKIFEGMRQIEKDIKENDKKIQELQKKLNCTGEKPKKIEIHGKPQTQAQPQVQQQPKFIPHYMRFAPPILHHPMSNRNARVHPFFFRRRNIIKPCVNQLKTNPQQNPHVHPCFFPRKYHLHAGKKNVGVKFAETEYIDIPKETNKTITITETNEVKETNEENEDLKLKMRIIDDWGECLLLKTQEIANRLTDKFKGLETLKIFSGLYDEEKKEEVKKEEPKKDEPKKEEPKTEKEIHFGVICDGCKMSPLVGKRYKCKGCHNFDFCEKCYEEKKSKHGHEFYVIEKSVFKKPETKKKELQLKNSNSSHGSRPEGVPKKLEHCPTAGNIFEKEKTAEKIVHFGVKCDQCKKYPIVGCRYKCSVCPNFDFCEDCEKKYSHLHNHAFFKINKPYMRNLIYKNIGKK